MPGIFFSYKCTHILFNTPCKQRFLVDNDICLSICLSVCLSVCLAGWLAGWLAGNMSSKHNFSFTDTDETLHHCSSPPENVHEGGEFRSKIFQSRHL